MGQYVKCSKKDLSLEQTWDRKEGIKPLASLTKMTEGTRLGRPLLKFLEY